MRAAAACTSNVWLELMVGCVVHKGTISHSYPHCWRCHSGLIFRATEQWFFSLNKNETFARFLIAKV